MKNAFQNGKGWAKQWALALFSLLLICCCILPFVGGRGAVKAAAASDSPCEVQSYTVNAIVKEDRTIDFDETITFTLNQSFNSFYRSLPVEGDRFLNIHAECEGNEEFFFDVAENPDVDGFMDINCYGGLTRGKTLTYHFTYTMQVLSAANSVEGMIIDFVGAGWPFALNNVTVNVQFPAAVQELYVYSSAYGGDGNDYAVVTQSADKTSVTITAEKLPLCYSSTYYEYMAAAITVDFSFESGVLISPLSAYFQGGSLWVVLGCIVAILAVFIILRVRTMGKPPVSPIVGFEPPDGMDPLTAGVLIDGEVNTEDVTSMIYYFASKGYLRIVMDDDDPVLVRLVDAISADETPAAHTLFKGLFKRGGSVSISDLECNYYQSIDHAKQLLKVKEVPMYEKKSVTAFIVSLLLSALAFVAVPWLVGLVCVGQGMLTGYTLVMLIPVVLVGVFSYNYENYRYRRKSKRVGIIIGVILILVVGAIPFLFFNTNNVLTMLERILLLIVGYSILWGAKACLTRTQPYVSILERLLGFQEFLVVTKEDKIKFLLEKNPELFYDLLPYAQVLGVTNEWEEKFKGITMQPPRWYGGYCAYDYYLLTRGMRRVNSAMVSRPQPQSTTGRSGGGGSFGGFSGGGGGGGGGGFR